jgi:gluconolactonase
VDAAATAHRVPGPPELLPGRPDAVVDLRTAEGAALVGARWRYTDATVREVEFVTVGSDLGPSGEPSRTFTVEPAAGARDFDDGDWDTLEPHELELRLGSGRVSFNWYRTTVTIPERIGDLDPTGSTAVFEIVVDDYAEVWVDGSQPHALGDAGGPVVAGFNAPNRVVLTRDARPGDTFTIAVFGINGPISADPRNYIWVRSATLDLYSRERARVGERAALVVETRDGRLDAVVPRDTELERIATGFVFTEGPVWHEGALLFSSPDVNTIYRWTPNGAVTVFRTKSGYTGADIGRYHQPGSNGLTFDPEGRLILCQHGNRRVLRVNPHGDVTVLADRYDGKRLNSPNDLVVHSDGTLYFTDPPFGLPGGYEDPKKELAFSGVYRVRDGDIALVTADLAGPNGIALSPDERHLYVGDWDVAHKAVVRFDVATDGSTSNPVVLCDLTEEDGDDAIDGIKVDAAGRLFVCGPGGVWVLEASGAVLGRLVLPEAPHNLAWGDADGRTLYVTAMTSVYRMRLPTGGRIP